MFHQHLTVKWLFSPVFVGVGVRGYVSFYFIFPVKAKAPHVGITRMTSTLQSLFSPHTHIPTHSHTGWSTLSIFISFIKLLTVPALPFRFSKFHGQDASMDEVLWAGLCLGMEVDPRSDPYYCLGAWDGLSFCILNAMFAYRSSW